jgi:hypothetical protein
LEKEENKMKKRVVSMCSLLSVVLATAQPQDSVKAAIHGSFVAKITRGGSATFCNGNSVLLSANASNSYIYQWKKDGTDIPGATSTIYQATSSGNYQVKIISGSSVAWSANVSVTVNSCGENDSVRVAVGQVPLGLIPASASIHDPNIFAVIGDYGSNSSNEAAVANLVRSWNPDFIITTGDNNYPEGAASTIDANIGKYYHDFIYPYTGTYGIGSDVNRFFPCLGNHDAMTSLGAPYYEYFTLPGNERYYDFIKGDIHFFVLNSEASDPDGNSSTSVQAMWLKNKLAASVSKWKIVYVHYSPYCSDSINGSQPVMRWPFSTWGADVLMTGHSHVYERLLINDFPYLVNGLGGGTRYPLISNPVQGSQIVYNSEFGAMKVTIRPDTLWCRFYNVLNDLIDEYPIVKSVIQSVLIPENDTFKINVYPNPTTGLFTFELCLDDMKEAKFNIDVLSSLGELVYSKYEEHASGCVKETIALDNKLSTGLYVLRLSINKQTENIRIMLAR